MYNIKIDFSMISKLNKDINVLDEKYKKAVKKALLLAGEYGVAQAKLKTTVGVYDPYEVKGEIIKNGKVGGSLRNAWNKTEIKENTKGYSLDVYNPLDYAQYYEYGHRQTPGRYVPQIGKKLKAKFVEGRFPLKKAMNDVEKVIVRIIKGEIDKVDL